MKNELGHSQLRTSSWKEGGREVVVCKKIAWDDNSGGVNVNETETPIEVRRGVRQQPQRHQQWAQLWHQSEVILHPSLFPYSHRILQTSSSPLCTVGMHNHPPAPTNINVYIYSSIHPMMMMMMHNYKLKKKKKKRWNLPALQRVFARCICIHSPDRYELLAPAHTYHHRHNLSRLRTRIWWLAT